MRAMGGIRVVATIIVVDRRGHVLLQHRTADAPVAPNKWGLPGGHINPGECPHDAARRELFEETGLWVDRLSLLWLGAQKAGCPKRRLSSFNSILTGVLLRPGWTTSCWVKVRTFPLLLFATLARST